MDVRIETTPMGAVATVATALVRAFKVIIHKTVRPLAAVVSFVRPSLHGTSLSAVAPDKTFLGGIA